MKKLALLLFTALGFVQAVSAATFTVLNPTDNDAGSLRQAIINANNAAGADTIIFDSGFFSTPRIINLTTDELVISDSVTIQGPGANLLTVQRDFNAATNFRVFNIPSGGLTVSISGMTISNGNSVGAPGGGINSQSTLGLTNVHVTGNQASIGGGVALDSAGGTFASCTFNGNIADTQGGGIEYESDGGRTLALTNSTVSGNTANGSGAGGGIFHGSGSGHGFLAAFNCTIANNSGATGGGIHTVAGGSAANTATTLLNNTIIANNTPTNLVKATFSGATAAVGSQGFNLSDNYNSAVTLLSTDLTGQPLLGPLSFNGGTTPTHALLSGSPALDKGNGVGIDQRGLARQFNITTISPASGGNDSDIGAVEMQALIVNSTADPGDGVCDATCTLRDAITAANANGTGLDDIIFDNTVFSTSRTISLLSVLPDITSSLTINAPGARLLTVQRDPGAMVFRIFNVVSGLTNGATITGMTIAGGNAGSSNFGGGINSQSNLSLTGVHLTGNTAGSGGGASLTFADGVFTSCTFSNNSSTAPNGNGAGMFFQGDGSHTLRLVSSTVSGNQSVNGAGGIVNFSNSGGSNSRLEITNSTIASNTANSSLGGILTITQSAASIATTTLRNTIIAGNTPNNLAALVNGGGTVTVTSFGFNLTNDNGGGFLNLTTDKINAFAGLAPLSDNGGLTLTHALLGSSAALDAGNNSGSGTLTDQRGAGFVRTVDLAAANAAGGDGTDIGAFEAQSAPVTPAISINDVSMNEGNSGTTSFTFTVTLSAANAQPVSVSYVTANGTATGGGVDYISIGATTLTFNPGEVSKQVTMLVIGDTTIESNETFFVNLTNAQGASISTPQGTGTIINDDGGPTPTVSPTATPTVTPGVVANVSTRLAVGTGDNALIEGFIVQGPVGSTKKILVRALGPFLAQFGITDALANPTLEIHDAGAGNAIVATNNDWRNTQVGGLIGGDQSAEIAASGLAPTNNLESAIIANLAPGSYTAVVRGAGNGVGTGIVDAYDLSAASPARLANIATRGLIQPGDKLMIAGFIVQNGSVRAVVRAVGPSLAAFGIANALPDTTLQLRDQNGAIVRENDDWKTNQQQDLTNTGLQPTDDREAALVEVLPPGQYTAQVRGKPEGTGIGVVEVYFLR